MMTSATEGADMVGFQLTDCDLPTGAAFGRARTSQRSTDRDARGDEQSRTASAPRVQASPQGACICIRRRSRSRIWHAVLTLAAVLVLLAHGVEGAKKGKGGGKGTKSRARKGDSRAQEPAADGSRREEMSEDLGDRYDRFCGLAIVDKGTGNTDQAIQRFGAAISQAPNITAGWLELGTIFGAGEHQARYKRKLYERYYTLECRLRRLQQRLRAGDSDVGVLLAAADVSGELLHHRQAVELLERALEADPGNGAVFVKLVEAQVNGCVFANWNDNFKRLEDFILQQAALGQPVVLGPIQSSVYPLPPQVGLAICKQAAYATQAAVLREDSPAFTHPSSLSSAPEASPGVGIGLFGTLFAGGGGERGRLTVGYVTSHFTSSSIGREMLFLHGAHAPQAVAAHCFALNADQGSWLQHLWRSNIAKACHQFQDVSSLDDASAAAAVNRHQVHILIDLNGWSGGHKVSLITRRPAPIQINYKNWVASSGIDALVFNVGDKVVCPPELQEYFSESLVLVPNSYFISGHRYQYSLDNAVQKASEVHSPPKAREAARLEHGLPPSNFLIANFNNLDKLEPRMWHLWCDLIRRYRRAALWLQKYPPARASRVQDMAKEEGKMDMARLVMTPFFKSDHHIGIKALADVFVDNPTYNAHSTAMDTLWGALPFVTLAEEKMAARVGASLLMALDSRWGVVRNLADMAAVVEALMTHPHTLRRLRQSMEEARHTAALFDTVRAVRNLEVALRLMWEAHAAAAAGLRGRPRPHIISRDVGPKSAGRGVAGQAGGAGDDALEARLFGMRVDTSKAEQTSGV